VSWKASFRLKKTVVGSTLLLALSLATFARGGEASPVADASAKVATQLFSHVEKKYVEPTRAVPKALLRGAFKAIEAQYPQVLINVDELRNEATVRVDEAEKHFDLSQATKLGGCGDILTAVVAYTAARLAEDGEEFERQELYYAAFNGALSALDPHSNAFTAEQFKEFMIGTRGSFGGIGFVFGVREGDMTIITPIDGTPADRAGLKTGDKILYIDGEPTINMAVDVAAGKMRGEPGTQVTLTVTRDGWGEPKAITFTREVIHVDSVESYVLEEAGSPPVLYAKVKNFQKDTTDELKKAVKEAEAKHRNLAGIILDFRNDPGGLLDQAIALSNGFLDRGTIVSTRGPEEESNRKDVASSDTPISKKPVVLLVNQGSASASEIVAGALKASRSILIGQKTFGKGSVQKLYPLGDGGALKLTVAQYLTPGDVSIQSIGIQPDIATYPVQKQKGQLRVGPPPTHISEAQLENAFKEWGNASEKPWREAQYLGDTSGEEEKPFAELTRAQKLARLRGEVEVRLARRILVRTEHGEPSRGRERLLKAAEPVLEELRREEEAKIVRALADNQVDWGDGKADHPPRLTVRFPREFKLEAGTTAEVTISVRNEGTQPVYRIWGRTDSANPLLKNLDFPFGRIEPGRERSWTTKIEVPKSSPDRWDSVSIALKSGTGQEAGSGQGGARQVALPAPRYAYSYELREENPGDKARSGNGILEEGERVELQLNVRNRGAVASTAVEVNIRGDDKSKLYLESARKRLEGLGPGERKEAAMAFRLLKADKDRKANVIVSITNRDYGVSFSDTLRLPVGKRLDPRELRDTRTPPDLEVLKPPLRTGAAHLSLEVKATDEDGIKDVYAFLGEKKVHYQRSRSRATVLPVRLELPLEPGSNRLVLFARDQKNMLTTRTYFIHRAESPEEGTRVGLQ
jgi:carboxyl-terminal processing protease